MRRMALDRTQNEDKRIYANLSVFRNTQQMNCNFCLRIFPRFFSDCMIFPACHKLQAFMRMLLAKMLCWRLSGCFLTTCFCFSYSFSLLLTLLRIHGLNTWFCFHNSHRIYYTCLMLLNYSMSNYWTENWPKGIIRNKYKDMSLL